MKLKLWVGNKVEKFVDNELFKLRRKKIAFSKKLEGFPIQSDFA